jgi:hypothetical protein
MFIFFFALYSAMVMPRLLQQSSAVRILARAVFMGFSNSISMFP